MKSLGKPLSIVSLILLISGFIAKPTLVAAQGTVIRIDVRRSRGPISPFIYGTNHRFFGNGVGMWDAVNKRAFPAFNAVYDEIGLRSLRYPAGTAAHYFEWKKAIGPVEQRGPVHRISGQQVFSPGERVTFGIDEAARWCESHNSEMVYMYGIGNSNAREAADLIEYLNAAVGTNPNGGVAWADVRARNGRTKPYNIRYFEIGNEMDGPSQKAWLPSITTAKKVESSDLVERRAAYAREYCFGGLAAFTKQPVKSLDDYREQAAYGSGERGQVKKLLYSPIEPSSDILFVNDQAWQRVPDIKKAEGGNVYQINNETGEIFFGDGKTGAIPPKDATIAASYRAKRDGFVDYYKAMKAVDPTIKIYAGFESKQIIHEMGDSNPYDGIVIHPYTATWNFPKGKLSPDDFHHQLMLSAEERAAELEEYQSEMRRVVGGERARGMHVVATEYGAIRIQDIQDPPNTSLSSSLDQALYTAQLLLAFMRTGMPIAHKHATIETGVSGVIGSAPDFIPTANARAFQTLTHMFGNKLVAVDVEGNPERVLPDKKKMLKLNVEASTDEQGNSYLVVINRDANDDVPANINLPGGILTTTGGEEVAVWTVNAPSYSSFNTAQNPDAVQLKRQTKRASGETFTHVFPAHSLTAIKFTKAK